MPDRQALQIVHTALRLAQTHPHARALDVLDLAMQGHEGSSPDFEAGADVGGDWVARMPPSTGPRRSSAPKIDTTDSGTIRCPTCWTA